MTRRRRGKRGRTSPDPPPGKRRRGGPQEREADGGYTEPAPAPEPAAQQPSSVMVVGLPPGCGVLELKSRLETYGTVARARVDAAAATGYVTFRSGTAAEAAIAASLDPDCSVTIGSKKVLVVQASEVANNSEGMVGAADPAGRSSHDATKNNACDDSRFLGSKTAEGITYKTREIVAYDDLF